MGASKGVLLSGVALIVGIYATGIHRADAIIAASAGTRVYQLQSDANARTGVRLALEDMREGGWRTTWTTVIFMGDTIRYDIDNLPTTPRTATITSSSRFKQFETRVVAYVEEGSAIRNRRGRRIGSTWTITKTYVVPNANEARYVAQ